MEKSQRTIYIYNRWLFFYQRTCTAQLKCVETYLYNMQPKYKLARSVKTGQNHARSKKYTITLLQPCAT